MKNITIVLSAILTLPVFTGCASEPLDAAEQEEAEATEADLTANAARLVGQYQGATARGIDHLVLKADGTFFATGDSGVRCIQAPCPSRFRIDGRFSATKNYLRLNKGRGEADSEFFDRYNYTLSGNSLKISSGAASSNLSKSGGYCQASTDCERQQIVLPRCATPDSGFTCSASNSCGWSCSNSNPVPANAEKISASSRGGFVRPGPAGSCMLGESYSLEIATRKLSWDQCEYAASGPYKSMKGSRVLSPSELGTFERTAAAVKKSTANICGADKPYKMIEIEAPAGKKTLVDDFYSCRGGSNTYVSNIESVLQAFSALAKN